MHTILGIKRFHKFCLRRLWNSLKIVSCFVENTILSFCEMSSSLNLNGNNFVIWLIIIFPVFRKILQLQCLSCTIYSNFGHSIRYWENLAIIFSYAGYHVESPLTLTLVSMVFSSYYILLCPYGLVECCSSHELEPRPTMMTRQVAVLLICLIAGEQN